MMSNITVCRATPDRNISIDILSMWRSLLRDCSYLIAAGDAIGLRTQSFSHNVERKSSVPRKFVEDAGERVFPVRPDEVHILKISRPVAQVARSFDILSDGERPQCGQRWGMVRFRRHRNVQVCQVR